MTFGDAAGHADAVAVREIDVHQHEIRLELVDHGRRLLCAVSHARHLEAVRPLDERGVDAGHAEVVVHDEGADGSVDHTGSTHAITFPAVAAACAGVSTSVGMRTVKTAPAQPPTSM